MPMGQVLLGKDGEPLYVYHNNKRMRCGYTTGSCATAAAKAAAMMLFSQKEVDHVEMMTPNGVALKLPVLNPTFSGRSASCAIRKDAGDDHDVTDGTLIYTRVSMIDDMGMIIDGGEGVGRVTKRGLDQPVGYAAINRVPRRMMTKALEDICKDHGYSGGLSAIVSVPDGKILAKRTFNPRLGIDGGISILGTSGIVEPMSEAALIDTIRMEMRMRMANGSGYLLAVPGNYGKRFVEDLPHLPSREAVKCGNFIGETIDAASEYNAKGLLFIGSLGKLVKIAGGIMNTHSRNADARMEIIAANAALADVDTDALKRIMRSVVTDEALDALSEIGKLEEVMRLITENIGIHLNNRAGEGLTIGAMVFSPKYGKLGETEDVPILVAGLAGP